MTSTPSKASARWRALIEQQAKSGESIARFCAAHGVAASAFYVWRKNLRDAAAAAPASAPLSLSFVALEPVESGASAVGIELLCRGGRCVRVPVGFDAATLLRLLDVVEGGA